MNLYNIIDKDLVALIERNYIEASSAQEAWELIGGVGYKPYVDSDTDVDFIKFLKRVV